MGLGVGGGRRRGHPDEVGCEFHPPGFQPGDNQKEAVTKKNCFYKEGIQTWSNVFVSGRFFKVVSKFPWIHLNCLTLVLVLSSLLFLSSSQAFPVVIPLKRLLRVVLRFTVLC